MRSKIVRQRALEDCKRSKKLRNSFQPDLQVQPEWSNKKPLLVVGKHQEKCCSKIYQRGAPRIRVSKSNDYQEEVQT